MFGGGAGEGVGLCLSVGGTLGGRIDVEPGAGMAVATKGGVVLGGSAVRVAVESGDAAVGACVTNGAGRVVGSGPAQAPNNMLTAKTTPRSTTSQDLPTIFHLPV